MKDERNLPTLQQLVKDVDTYAETEKLNYLLCQTVPEAWVIDHPIIKSKDDKGRTVPYKYLPIDKVEYLLRKIFRRFKIEITGQGHSFNGVWVTVRVWYLDLIKNEWMFHDGIGAMNLQTKKGMSPADLGNINSGALSMAYPHAKTLAVKDACDHFGDLFGSNLNRRNTQAPPPPDSDNTPLDDETKFAFDSLTEADQVRDLANSKAYKHLDNNVHFNKMVRDKIKELS